EILSRFSGKLREIIKQERRRTQIRNSGIEVDDFLGGPGGFELISRFCYNNGAVKITVSNVSLLHCCAISLGMTENVSTFNLLEQTQIFLEGMFYWSWNDLLTCLKSCEPFFDSADSSGLVQKLICSLLTKISQNSDTNLVASSSSSSSSPEVIGMIKPCSKTKTWWFNGLTMLHPVIIEKFVKTLGGYGSDNNSLILTRFLLHYLKSAVQGKRNCVNSKAEYGGLADTAVHGVLFMGRSSFSCRGLFSVLRVVGGLGLSRECRVGLERLIGRALSGATLDDLLVTGRNGGVYDVNLVVRLVRLFVHSGGGGGGGGGNVALEENMKKVGRLIDNYLREIAPDHNLKISKFLEIAESLPDFARESFDGVYRAIDIYLEQSHPSLSFEEQSRLCRCLNYEKLSLEACKDLAKNPRIPPRIAVQALASQHPNLPTNNFDEHEHKNIPIIISRSKNTTQRILYKGGVLIGAESSPEKEEEEENDYMKLNLRRMQWRLVELEKECREIKGRISGMVKSKDMVAPAYNTIHPKLC
ncbi:hypothetical protein U1Q18_002687, partial [Sarracenia purpurea var. burkii]